MPTLSTIRSGRSELFTFKVTIGTGMFASTLPEPLLETATPTISGVDIVDGAGTANVELFTY